MTAAHTAVTGIVSLDLCSDWMLAYYADPTQVRALSPLWLSSPLPDDATDTAVSAAVAQPHWPGYPWPVHDGSLEQIYRLAPGQVIVGQYNASLLRSRLQALGVPVTVLPLPTDLAGIAQYQRHFLQLIGRTELPVPPPPVLQVPAADAPRLLLLGANGIGTGQGTMEDQILRQAGWRNYLPESGYIALDLERITRDPPAAILWSAPHSPALANRFSEHPLLRRLLPPERWLGADYWRWQCPGPWTWQLIAQLTQYRERLSTQSQPNQPD